MKLLKPAFYLFLTVFIFTSCDAIKQATNSTGTGFSLNGKWQLKSSSPENTLVGSVVSVTSFVSEGKIVTLQNNTQCYRENDIKWKDIKAQTNGSFTINNLLSNCSSGDLNYKPAIIEVVTNDQIKITGNNVAGANNVQTWDRVK